MKILKTNIKTDDDGFKKNKKEMDEALNKINKALEEAYVAGGVNSGSKLKKKGKMTLRERIKLVLDEGSPFLEIAPLAGWNTKYETGGGAIAGIGCIHGVECMIFGNDPAVKAGMAQEINRRILERALEISLENRIPYITFTESSGADLSGLYGSEDEDVEASLKNDLNHFQSVGRMFYSISDLSKRGIPTIAVVLAQLLLVVRINLLCVITQYL